MDLKQFEDNLNKKFENFEPEVDSLKIWDNIEEELPSKSKAKFGLWFAIALIPIACYFLLSVNNDILAESNSKIENTDSHLSNNSDVPSSTIFTEVEKGDIEEVAKQNPITNDASNIIVDVVVENESSTMISDVDKNVNESNKEIVEKPQQTFTKKKQTFAEAKSVNRKTIVDETKEISQAKDNEHLADHTKASEHTDQLPDLQEANNLDEAIEDKVIAEELAEEKSIQEPSEEVTVPESIAPDVKLPTTDLNAESTTQSTITDLLPSDSDDVAGKVLIDGVADEKMQDEKVLEKRLSLSLLAGVLGTNRIYEQSADQMQQLVIAEKETAEKQLETLQFEALIRYRITPRISIGTGLRNWKLTEESNYTTESITEDFVNVATGYVHHPDNTIETMTSTVPITYYETVTNTRYQTHQSWSIPLRLYVSLLNSEKFELELAGGYEISVSGKHVGYEFDGNKTEYLMTLDNENRYEKSGGNFFLFDINTNYKLKNSLSLNAGLEGKYGINGFNTETSPYLKKYHFFGLYAGLTYSF